MFPEHSRKAIITLICFVIILFVGSVVRVFLRIQGILEEAGEVSSLFSSFNDAKIGPLSVQNLTDRLVEEEEKFKAAWKHFNPEEYNSDSDADSDTDSDLEDD